MNPFEVWVNKRTGALVITNRHFAGGWTVTNEQRVLMWGVSIMNVLEKYSYLSEL
jgi:hypothetical protein